MSKNMLLLLPVLWPRACCLVSWLGLAGTRDRAAGREELPAQAALADWVRLAPRPADGQVRLRHICSVASLMNPMETRAIFLARPPKTAAAVAVFLPTGSPGIDIPSLH
nr:hypothetical protein BaRGS_008578 [Batillaria attramentaria]